MYGSHSHSHSTGPPHSSPSQPEWRLPATTQHQHSSWSAGSVAPPPPPSPSAPTAAPPYHPNTYGSISNISPGTARCQPVCWRVAGIKPCEVRIMRTWGILTCSLCSVDDMESMCRLFGRSMLTDLACWDYISIPSSPTSVRCY